MKIVIDMYGLGFKMHDLTEDQILMAVGRQPQYRERVYYWGEALQCCKKCPIFPDLKDSTCKDVNNKISDYCLYDTDSLVFLQPYFKKEVI